MSNTCRHCQALDRFFDAGEAQRELRRYRKRGPARTTRLLVQAIAAQDIAGWTLLDIGGGIGAIQLALLAAGAESATDVDASQAYLDTARHASAQDGVGDRVRYFHGDFVALAPELAAADIVTLERVVCCFPDMPALIGASARKAQRLYGLVYPRDTWWMRLGARLINAALWLQRSAFRFFIHSQVTIEDELRRAGLVWRYAATAGPWRVALYARPAPTSGD